MNRNEELLTAIKKSDANVEEIRALLDDVANRVDLEYRDIIGMTPLSWACCSGHADIAALLLDRGADIDSRNDNGETPLSWACYYGHANVAALLLDRGADIGSRDKGGNTPLSCACSRGYADIVELLLVNNADIEAKDNKGKSVLDYASKPEIKRLIEEEQERRLTSNEYVMK